MKVVIPFILYFFFLIMGRVTFGQDWSQNYRLPLGETRHDIFELGEALNESVERGKILALNWPVEVTGMLVPFRSLKYFLEADKKNPLRRLISRLGKGQLGFDNLDELYSWLGLNDFPDESDNPSGDFHIPYPLNEDKKPDYKMGVSFIHNNQYPNTVGLSFSCATCHSGRFIGRSVMGLTNKRPRANEFFVMAKKYLPYVPSDIFGYSTASNQDEVQMFKRTKENIKYIWPVRPQALGLDTSLPHVALSLHLRGDDEYASKIYQGSRRSGRKLNVLAKKHPLENMVADSKPMPWWNLKYKNRWLSDGSIVAGNPILTNLLWNEIGRGTDLRELENWMKKNSEKIDELTSAAFASRAPHWTDFYPANSIDVISAKRGQNVFNQSCRQCHGEYLKGWNLEVSKDLSEVEKLKTLKVIYHESTPVIDVGTDPNRYLATKTFASDLNRLKISKWMKTVVVPQVGYVPPPLEGIFLRYPYMHNNSIPNLCELMKRPEERVKQFVQGPSENVEDFDEECIGYPTGDKIPQKWWSEREAIYDTNRDGMKNIGHSSMFYDNDGNSLLSNKEKKDLLSFLKTL